MRVRTTIVLALSVAAAGLGLLFHNRGTPPTELPPTAPPGQGAVTPASLSPGYFEDVTAGSGLTLTYRNGVEAGHATIFESVGGGVALLDYDGDGLLDIFLTGGGYFDGPDRKAIRGHPCKLYRNLGGFKFKDVTAEAGLAFADRLRLADQLPLVVVSEEDRRPVPARGRDARAGPSHGAGALFVDPEPLRGKQARDPGKRQA